MSTHKHINKICVVAILFSILLSFFMIYLSGSGSIEPGTIMGYESRLFDTTKVHTIDSVMEDWDGFISTAQSEEYSACSVVIDGEAFKNVGIRGKGNTSLSNVSSMNSERYSFKIEFDQYDNTNSYYGLDKLCLNNIIQDNTYMKDYLVYQMMQKFGVDAPLCSFVSITVNGEDWGLYLAVEGVEESFLQRNYGSNYGELYKPDSMSFGGGRGNGKDFDMNSVSGMGSSDVKLQYIDDNADSYSNIFDNAKTNVTEADENRLIASLKQLSAYENIEEVVDVEEVLRYFVVHNFVVNDDSYTGSMIHNYYLYEKDGQMSMIPWDYNLAFGTFQGNNASSAINDDIDDVLSDRPMQAWIFSNETYSQRYYELYEELLDTIDIQTIIEDAYELIDSYVEKDPTAFCTYEEFQTGVNTLKEFCSLRTESIKLQLSGSTETVDASGITLSDMGTMSNSKGNMDFGNKTENEGEIEMQGGMGRPGETGQFGNMDQSGEVDSTQSAENQGEVTMPQMPEGMEMPDGTTMPEGMEMPEGTAMPDGTTMPDGATMPEGMTRPDEMTIPGGNDTTQEGSTLSDMGNMMNSTQINGNLTEYFMLGLSVLILIIGIVFVSKFKRTKNLTK